MRTIVVLSASIIRARRSSSTSTPGVTSPNSRWKASDSRATSAASAGVATRTFGGAASAPASAGNAEVVRAFLVGAGLLDLARFLDRLPALPHIRGLYSELAGDVGARELAVKR